MEIRRRRQQNKAAAVTAASDACESTWSKQKTRNVRVIYIPRVLDWQRGIENTHSQVYQASDWPSSNAWKQDPRCSSVNRKRLMKQMNWSTQACSVTTMNRPVLRRSTEQTWTIVYGGIVFLNIFFSNLYSPIHGCCKQAKYWAIHFLFCTLMILYQGGVTITFSADRVLSDSWVKCVGKCIETIFQHCSMSLPPDDKPFSDRHLTNPPKHPPTKLDGRLVPRVPTHNRRDTH